MSALTDGVNAELKERAFELAKELSDMPMNAVSEMQRVKLEDAVRCLCKFLDIRLWEDNFEEKGIGDGGGP